MAGLLGGLFGGGGANVKGETKAQKRTAGRLEEVESLLFQNYYDNKRAGAYDPNARLDLFDQEYQRASKIGQGNLAAASRTLGYRPGDTLPLNQLSSMSRKQELAYAQGRDAIKQDAFDRGSDALLKTAGVGGSLLGNAASIYGNVAQQKMQAAQQPSGIASILGAVTPFLAAPATGGASLMARSDPFLLGLPGGGRGITGPDASNPFYR